jgi:hypothetical protein
LDRAEKHQANLALADSHREAKDRVAQERREMVAEQKEQGRSLGELVDRLRQAEVYVVQQGDRYRQLFEKFPEFQS